MVARHTTSLLAGWISGMIFGLGCGLGSRQFLEIGFRGEQALAYMIMVVGLLLGGLAGWAVSRWQDEADEKAQARFDQNYEETIARIRRMARNEMATRADPRPRDQTPAGQSGPRPPPPSDPR